MYVGTTLDTTSSDTILPNDMCRSHGMKSSIIINVIITTAAAVFLVVLAFHVNDGATFDSIAVLKTNGMTCSSCSGRVTTALEMEKGVAVAEVDMAGGWVVVGYDRKTVNPEKLAQKITSIGFNTSS